jgi:hypothetical protein
MKLTTDEELRQYIRTRQKELKLSTRQIEIQSGYTLTGYLKGEGSISIANACKVMAVLK